MLADWLAGCDNYIKLYSYTNLELTKQTAANRGFKAYIHQISCLQLYIATIKCMHSFNN